MPTKDQVHRRMRKEIAQLTETVEQLQRERDAARELERERCAAIAEAMRPTGGRMWTDEQPCFAALSDCADAIRKPE